MTNGTSQSKTSLVTELLRNGQLAWRLLGDRRVSLALKLFVPGLMAAYFFWPADLLPDVMIGLGQLDDLAVFALAVKLFITLAPKDVVRQHRDQMAGGPAAKPADHDNAETVDAEYRVVD